MGFNLKRLQEVAKPESAKEQEETKYREENRDWLLKSMQIALYLEHVLRLRGISKKQLANMIDVTPAQVTKLLSGKENLGLKTIAKIEKALGVRLVSIPSEIRPYQFKMPILASFSTNDLSFKEGAGYIGCHKSTGDFALMSKKHGKQYQCLIC